MTNPRSVVVIAAAILVLWSSAACADCGYSLKVADPGGTGFAAAAEAAIDGVMCANGCVRGTGDANPGYELIFEISGIESDKDLNWKGLLTAGGLSSAILQNVAVAASLEVVGAGGTVFSRKIDERNRPHEVYSGLRWSKSTKKRTVEAAARRLSAAFLETVLGEGSKVELPPRGNSDFVDEDRDLWPFLGGGFSGIAVHEFGHHLSARLLGHEARFQGNDSRVFKAGFEMVAGFSLLYSHHIGDDQLLPLLPDVLYDFDAYETSAGLEYVDENGQPVSHGRRDHAFLAYAGIMFQNINNEILLTRHPDLIDMDKPYMKGMFFGNIVVPLFYTVKAYGDPNSDLLLLQRSTGLDRWQVNAMVIAPAALDVYRYYHPEKKKLRRYARIAKIIPVIVCLSQ